MENLLEKVKLLVAMEICLKAETRAPPKKNLSKARESHGKTDKDDERGDTKILPCKRRLLGTARN